MFKSKIVLALALSAALLQSNAMAMDQQSQSKQQAETSWTRLKRQLIKPLAFLCGAAALGGIVYAGNSQSNPATFNRAEATAWAAFIGGITGMSYTRRQTDNTTTPPITRKGSFAACLGFAATTALFGGIAGKLSNGTSSNAIYAYFAGSAVADAMYYMR